MYLERLKSQEQDQLKRLVQSELRICCSLVGPHIRKFQADSIDEHLYGLTTSQLSSILAGIRTQNSAMAGAGLPESIQDRNLNKSMFENALRLLGASAVDDVTSHFEDGDIIEIYDRNHVQRFHNLEFLKHTSYDLTTIWSKPFFELYSRSDEAQAAILAQMEKMFNRPTGTEPFQCPPHIIFETYMNSRKRFLITPKWMSPLIGASGQTLAVALTNRPNPFELKTVGLN